MKKRTSQKERYEALYAASEPFRRAKTETIHTLAGIGRRHRLLRYPIMAALVVYIFIYNLILYGCIQLKMRERLARGVALLMTAVLVLTSVDATVFAAIGNAGASEQGKGVITAFSRLDESVAVQVLPVGAKESEITLPDTLAVTLKTGSEDKPEESTSTTEESTTAPEEGTTATEKSTTAPEEGTTATEKSTTAPEESTTATEESTTAPEESTTAAEESTKQEETSAATEDTKTEENVPVKNSEQSSTEGTSATGENNLSSLLPQPMVVHAAEMNERASAKSEVLIDVTWKPDADKSTSGTFDSSEVGNRYVYMPVIPEDYTVAEGVKLPEITITIEENLEDKTATAAEKLLEKILQTYFEGLTEDEIYDAILRMDKDTRLALTADYEELLAAQTAEDEDNERLQKQIKKIGDALMEAAGNEPIEEPVFLGLRSTAVRASSSGIPLKRQSGSGEAFIYHSFNETTMFEAGRTYAFLNGKYGSGDAVSALGSGAILKATNKQNDSKGYITNYYNNDNVEVYVDVVTPGSDFDWCVIGGLYKVPNTQNPTEYRYFCGYGGARNCGPYYAYNYQRESVTSGDVSASLKNINKQGSENPGDYTVTITYDGNKSKVLDSGSYTVDYIEPDTARFVIFDSEGNSLTVNFQSPLAVRYDGNSKNVSGIPSIQEAWKNKSITLSAQKPTRTGYSFVNWKDADTGITYAAGQGCTPAKSVKLLAQWKDTQAPDFNYTNVQVMTSDSDEAVKNAVKAALTITDNEPASECTVTVTLPADFNKTPGNKAVTVKVTDKAGNTTTKTCSVYVDSYVDIARPVFTEGSKNITAVLNGPGTDAITESGFVWGVINSPTLTLNNGRATTAAPVSKVGDRISVTAGNLQKGVQYYARAYIIAGGETYYSEEIPIGLGLPDYGKFTISNNGSSTFTVTRDGSEGTQTVYYRTVNGSAVGGTHFKHKNGTLTFAPGDKEETIKITEYGANTAYSGKPATAYTNADRTYSVEIYHVTGGAALGDTTSAERTMKMDSEYYVNRSVYTTEKSRSVNTNDDNNYVVDRDDVWEKQVSFINNRGYNNRHGNKNFNVQRSIDVGNDKENAYLKETATGFSYKLKLSMTEHSWAGGYEHVWISNHEPNDLNGKSEHGDTISLDDSKFGKAYYTARWEIKGHSEGDETGYFPGASGVTWAKQSERSGKVSDGYVLFAPKDTAQVWFTATGGADNIWHVNSYTDWLKVSDTQEPKLVKVAPMAGGTYKVGDSFTVSLIFDEIVDSTNSGSLTNIKVDTTWGEASYKGGVDTNVLYFTGKIKNDPTSTTLSVNSFTNPGNIKDMCNDHDKATESGGGGTGATVDISAPNFTVKPNDSITNGTGTATIKVEADQSKTTGMSYAWSNSTNLPASGWVELSSAELSTAKSSSGLPLSIRKQPGSGDGGKWYLHVKGVYATTGASSHKYATLNFGTEASPVTGSTSPKLSVTTDNTNWATSRTISITQEGAEVIKYRKSGATSWNSLNPSTTSVTVYDNGNYTFLLKAGDESITKTVTVDKIDKVDPAASIGELTGGSVESPKSGVYTKLVLPITYSDAQSGVKTVNYSWADSTSSPFSWTSLPAGAATVTYTATESTPTKKYLHIKVADKVNHIYKTYSVPYTVISQTAVNNHAPKISITGAPTKWTNDMATLTWQLQNYNSKNYEVILPSGKKQTAENGEVSKGEVWARQNGTYTVKVHDLEYGGENTASITVNKLDFTAPSVTVSGGSDDWENTNQTFTISASDTQSGVGEKWYKIVTNNSEIPVEGLTKLNGNQITVNKDGEYYVYYKVYDNTGDTAAGREANKTEGFTRLVKIDKTAPVIGELTYSYQPKKLWNWLIGKDSLTITVPVTEEGSGADKISYKVMPEGGSSATKTAEIKNGSAKITVSADFKGEISITCTDKVGNTSSGVTVGTSGNGLILEDNAPEITFSTYTAASGITVTVKDEKDNAISAGLASVTYTIGNSTKAVSGDFNTNKKTQVSFTIPVKDIPTGGAVIAVIATDHAGNQAELTKEIAKYNVTYDYGTNGGVSAVSAGKVSDVVLSGDAIDLTPKAQKDGWEFVGWNTDKNAVNGLTSLKMGTKDVTLYAIYSKTLTGTFYSGKAGQSETVSVTIYNTAKSGTIALPALKGWTGDSHGFTAVGWLPDSGEALPAPVDSKDLLNVGGSYALSENKSFYGKYKLDVTLSFDANGGEGSENAVSGVRYAVVEQSKITYPDAGEVTLPTGKHMSRAGYDFAGWTVGGTTGTVLKGGASVKLPEQDTVYYASWADTKQPELTAGIQSGVQANDDGWYNVDTLHIALDYSDNEGVAKLYGKVDNGDFAQISGISTAKGTSFRKDYACTEGEHTYTFKAEDAVGNVTETKSVTVKWDKTKPEIGEVTCEQKAANILDWIIGKESLIVSIPVTDSLSGVKTLTYTETKFTKDSEETEEKTVSLSGQEQTAKLTLDADWKGTITDIRCTDTAGNISEAKSIEGAGNGIIVEDNAPVIKFTSPASNENGWYNRNIAIAVTVTDDKDSESAVHLSGGIAEIKWKEGKDGDEQTVTDLDGNAPVYEHEFTISVSTDGTHTYYVYAVDNAGNESGWQTVTAKVDTGKPEFAGSLTVTNPTVEGAEITLTSSESGKVYYIVSDAGTAPDAQEVKEQGTENGGVKSVTDGTEGSFTVKGLTPGEKHTVYVVLEDAAGNLSEVKKESFFTMPEVPDITMEQITVDYTNETMKLPDTIGEVEVYTNPDDPSGSKITPNDDGFLPVTPGTVIYIRYPERTKDGLTVPASDKIEIQIPDRPVPEDKQVAVTDNAITLTNPDSKEEYVLVKKGETPDWSKANTTGQFTGLDADTEYDLYVRVKATENNFVSVSVKMELRTKDHILQKTEAKAPTCTEAGNREYFTCSDCHKLFEDEQGKTETDSAKVTIPAAGHTEVTDKAKAATCTKTGLTEGSRCSVCGAILKKQKTVAALGHDYSAGYQYNKDGHWKSCSRCGKKDEKHSHTYDNGSDTRCNDCGYKRTITKPKEDDEKKPGNDDEKNTADEQADTQDNKPEKEQNPDSADTSETTETTETKTLPADSETQTVPATVDNGKITVPGNPVATGKIDGVTGTTLMLGDGAVIVTVNCKEQKCTAGVADTVAVANAVLTPEQIQLVNNGETIEIRIDVTDISDKIPLQEQEVIESGVEEYQKELPKLMLGMYVDISMFIKIGESDWNTITKTNEAIEIILGVPENLKETGRTYYIIRSHEGEHTLLTDLDDNPDTITISTGLFSAYAIAYEKIDVQKSGTENHKCGLCHICPTFLGICYFIWLAIIVLTIILVLSILYKRKEREEEKLS